jgi:AcrR family transcriptional regulator
MSEAAREALLDSILIELGEHGYADISLESACRAANVDGAAAAEFADIDECLFAAYEQLSTRLVGLTKVACQSESSWPDQVRAGLEALLAEIAAKPGLAKAATRSFPAIGPAAYRRYVDLLNQFVPMMTAGRELAEVDEPLPGEVELLAIGAAESIIFAEVDAGRAGQLPAMLPEILFSVLVPLIGPERATEEMRSAATA